METDNLADCLNVQFCDSARDDSHHYLVFELNGSNVEGITKVKDCQIVDSVKRRVTNQIGIP